MPSRPRSTRSNLPALSSLGCPFPVGVDDAVNSVSAANPVSTRVSNSFPPVAPAGVGGDVLGKGFAPAWPLTAGTLQAQGPLTGSIMAILSRGGQPSATTAATVLAVTAGVAWQTVM